MAARLSLPAALSWQPQSIPRLARGALTENLIDAIFPYGDTMVSVNRWGTDYLSQTASPTWGANKLGRAAVYNGSTQYHFRNSAPEPLKSSQSSLKEVSMLVALKVGGVGATTEAFSYGLSGGGVNDRPLFMFGNGVTGGKAALRLRDSANTNVEIIETGSSLVFGETRIFVATRSESQNKALIFRDGQVIVETTAGTALTAVNFDRTCLGGLLRGAFGLGAVNDINFAASWFRALSLDEAVRISANPWQLFEFPSRPIIINSSAAVAYTPFPPSLNIKQAVNRASTY